MRENKNKKISKYGHFFPSESLPFKTILRYLLQTWMDEIFQKVQ